MHKAILTYGLLDKRLRALGFAVHTLKDKARIYKHDAGASIFLPDAPFEQDVFPHHLVVVRRVLKEYDLADLDNGQIIPLGTDAV